MFCRGIVTLFFVLFTFLSSFAATSLEQAKNRVKDYVTNTLKLDEYRVMYTQSQPSSILLMFNKKSVAVPSNSWVFFIDEKPAQDWAHDCRYAFVSKSTGSLTVTRNILPPSTFDGWVEYFSKTKNADGRLSDGVNPNLIDWNLYSTRLGSASSRCHAILISGGWNKYNNNQRYWNNCSMVYQMLTKCYGFSTSNINVLMADGTNPAADLHLSNNTYINSPADLDGNGRNDIQYPATKSSLTHVFDSLKVKLNSLDELFIYVTDHGDEDGSICLWGQSITPAEFAREVDKLSFLKSISIVMVQCFSGAHIPTLQKPNRTIITAARSCESAYSTYDYSLFGRRWVEAMAKYDAISKKSCNPDFDSDYKVSMLESFVYANSFKNSDNFGSEPLYWSDGCFGEKQFMDGLMERDLIYNSNIASGNIVKKGDNYLTSKSVISGGNVKFLSYGQVLLKSTFAVTRGATFTAKILDCEENNHLVSCSSLRSLREDDEEFYDGNEPLTSGIEETSASLVSVWPNPTTGMLYVRASDESAGCSVTVVDALGKVLLSKETADAEVELDLTGLNSGIYFVKVVSGSESKIEKVVLK